MKADDVIMHAQRTVGNGVLVVPPHDFEHLSRWYYQLYSLKKYCCGLRSNGVISIPNLMKILLSIPEFLLAETVVRKAAGR
jgi:hypothetical protein